MLWRTDLHCYFTRPYVTSWGLFEAAACGTRLVVSEGEATYNIANHSTVTWINLDNQKQLKKKYYSH